MKFNNLLKSLTCAALLLNVNTFSMEKDAQNGQSQELPVRMPSPVEDSQDYVDQNNDQFQDDWSDNEQDIKDKAEELEVLQTQQARQESKKKNENRLPSLYTMKQDALIKLLEENNDVVLDEPYIKSIKLTHLMFAAQQNQERLLTALLKSEKNKDVNAQDDIGYTALHYAAIEGKPSIINKLLEAGADKTKMNKDGKTPYMLAIEHSKVAAANLLLAQVVFAPQAQPSIQSPATQQTIEAEKDTTAQAQFEYKREVEESISAEKNKRNDRDKKSDNGDDINTKTKRQEKFIKAKQEWMTSKDHQDFIALLKKNQNVALPQDLQKYAVLNLIKAVEIHDMEVVDMLLQVPNLDLTIRDPENGHNVLTMAADCGNLDIIIKLLRNKKIDVDQPDEDGTTALIWTCIRNYVDIAKTLLDAGANVNNQDKPGESALLRAAFRGSQEMVALLLSRGAFINTLDKDDITPLCEACRKDHVGVAQLLLAHNADKNFDADKRLLQLHKADVNHKDKFGNSPLIHAASAGNCELIALLLSHSANINILDKHGITPLCEACRKGHLGAAKLLLAHNANNNFNGDKSLMQRHKAHVNHQDEYGRTPLIFAVKSNNPKLVKLIIDCNPDLGAKYRGKNALQIAQEESYKKDEERSANKAICSLLMPLFKNVSEQNCSNFLDELEKENQKAAKEKQRKRNKKKKKKEAWNKQTNSQVEPPSPRQSTQSQAEQDQTKPVSKEDKIKELEIELANKKKALIYFQKKLTSKKNDTSSNNASPDQSSKKDQMTQSLLESIKRAEEKIQEIREKLAKLKSN